MARPCPAWSGRSASGHGPSTTCSGHSASGHGSPRHARTFPHPGSRIPVSSASMRPFASRPPIGLRASRIPDQLRFIPVRRLPACLRPSGITHPRISPLHPDPSLSGHRSASVHRPLARSSPVHRLPAGGRPVHREKPDCTGVPPVHHAGRTPEGDRNTRRQKVCRPKEVSSPCLRRLGSWSSAIFGGTEMLREIWNLLRLGWKKYCDFIRENGLFLQPLNTTCLDPA